MIISEKYKTDVVDKGNAVGISFASDVSRFVGNADSKIRAKVYNNLAKLFTSSTGIIFFDIITS